jgi:hypothetical protein
VSFAGFLESLLPLKTERDAALTVLVQDIRQAHTLSPDRWGVTQGDDHVRLNVGRVEVMAIFRGFVHVILDARVRPAGIENLVGVDLNPKSRTKYRAVPDSFACSIPAAQLQAAIPLFAQSHEAFIVRASKTPRHSTMTAAHSPPLLRGLEASLGVSLPDPSYTQPLPALGTLHSWQDVQDKWGGNQTFLAKRDGRIICATLDRAKNPDAPRIMVVGHKPINTQRGQEFCQQGGPIPLFIKEDVDRWRYHGEFEVERFTDERAEVVLFENTESGPLSRVIFLRQVDGQGFEAEPPDIDYDAIGAVEGRRRFVQHLAAERVPSLAKAKRRQVLEQTKRLACEVCGFDFAEFYKPYADKFCEVHHRKPLGELDAPSRTTLEDLAVLCSNCHRVIHLIKPMPTVEDLRRHLAK